MLEADYYPYRVYQNILKMLEYRRLELVDAARYPEGGHTSPLTSHEFLKQFQAYRYCLIVAKDLPDHERRWEKRRHDTVIKKEVFDRIRTLPVDTYILLLVPDSPDIESAEFLRKLLTRIGLDAPAVDRNSEVLLVHRSLAEVRTTGAVRGEEGVLKTNILKTLKDHERMGLTGEPRAVRRTVRGGREDMKYPCGLLTFQPVPYSCLLAIPPEHVSVPRHTILTRVEEKQVLKDLRITRTQLLEIKRDEPMGIWLGLVPKMIVRIHVDLEPGGHVLQYRHVRPGKSLG